MKLGARKKLRDEFIFASTVRNCAEYGAEERALWEVRQGRMDTSSNGL
ncbi:hypothetical protein M2322_002774 [Rhodoblastus acidophilus]|nr:hypothetical protein [Rhodoblastus acidophilus]